MALPYKCHPLYHFRRVSICIAIIGIVLCCIAISPYYPEVLGPSIAVLAVSALFCAADLLFYALKKVEKPDEDPEWPVKKFILGDLVFAVVLQYLFWMTLAMIPYSYSPNAGFAGAYAALAQFLCSVLHTVCFWKQVMARYKKKWLAEVLNQPCERCGYSQMTNAAVPTPQPNSVHPPNNYAYAGPSAEFRQANVVTPSSPESAMEEGLLIDHGAGYGSVDHGEPVIREPEEVIVAKGSKKKATSSSSSKVSGREHETHADS